MFWKRYRKDADTQHLSNEATDRVLTVLRAENAKKNRPRTALWPRAAAVAVCAALVLGAVWLLPKDSPIRSFYPEDGAVKPLDTTAQLTYDDVLTMISGLGRGNLKGDALVNEGRNPINATRIPGQIKVPTDDSEYTGAPLLGSDTTTNTQYANVDEADVVKAAGDYIYSLNRSQHTLTVYHANGRDTAVVATRKPAAGDAYLRNMYLAGNRLVVLYTCRETEYADDVATPYSYMHNRAYAVIYDITDPAEPRQLTTYGQDGTLMDSRMVDGVLYLITDHTVWSVDEEDAASYIPSLYRDGTSYTVKEQDLLAVHTPDAANYAVITATKVVGQTQRLAEKSVLGAGNSTVWANATHLMLMQQSDRSATTETYMVGSEKRQSYVYNPSTDLLLFDITDGKVVQAAAATVDGSLDGQFALDEYNGYFRLATSCSRVESRYSISINDDGEEYPDVYIGGETTQSNRLYVLDDELKEVGRIHELAPNEAVQSVRFDGDIGYVVTFRQTDPLFTIDLSDPTNPTVLSALKITGFSEYLHPFVDNRLFGFGYAGTATGLNGKLKLTMFNTDDKTDVTVQHCLELPAADYSSEGLSDHHAILVDTARLLVGMPLYTQGGVDYVLYRYREQTGFEQVLRCSLNNAETARGLFIDDYFYVVTDFAVQVYDRNFTPVATT